MPEIPEAIRTAAREAAASGWHPEPDEMTRLSLHDAADAVTDAIAPLLAEAVAQKILAHMESAPARGGHAIAGTFLARRRHFETAARVAAGAFTTDAEKRQQVIAALSAGNFIACDPEAALLRAAADAAPVTGISMDDLREEVAGYALAAPPATTPECEPHEPMPSGYIARSNWADVMMETHDQRTCKGCGLWLIWGPKPGVPAPPAAEGSAP